MNNFCYYDKFDRYKCRIYEDYEKQQECVGYSRDAVPTHGIYWCSFYAANTIWQACCNPHLRDEAKLQFKLEEL